MRYVIAQALLLLALFAAPAVAAGGDNPFAGTIYQGIAAATVFVVVLLILRKAAWGPILSGLQAREERIRTDLEGAEVAAKQAQETLQEYQKKLADAQEEARKVIDQSRADAQKLGEQLKQQTQAEIETLRTRSEGEIRAAKEQAISDLYSEAASLATMVAGKILDRQVNEQDQQRLVEESLAELSKV